MDTMKELLAMAQIKKHPNLVEFFGLVTVDKSVCFLVEFCEKGSLDRLHKKEDLLAKPKYLYIIRDVCSGLHVLHTARVIHRDLACRNLLMRQDGTVAISDYGLSRRLGASNVDINKPTFAWVHHDEDSGDTSCLLYGSVYASGIHCEKVEISLGVDLPGIIGLDALY
mmetsp:Transcript_30882/g.59544  ORF Transcript_30882/g.59544 Transcript_30882/m.59544 type:complete len:168 (-) Transcript_30882:581-1084(-)